MSNSHQEAPFLHGHSIYKGMVKVLPAAPSPQLLRKSGGRPASTPGPDMAALSSSRPRPVHYPVASPSPLSSVPVRLPPPPNNPKLNKATLQSNNHGPLAMGVGSPQNGNVPASNGHGRVPPTPIMQLPPLPPRPGSGGPTSLSQAPGAAEPPSSLIQTSRPISVPSGLMQPPRPVVIPPTQIQPPRPIVVPPSQIQPPRPGPGSTVPTNSVQAKQNATFQTGGNGVRDNGCDVRKLQDEMAQLKLELAAMNQQMREDDVWMERQSEQVKELAQQQKQLETNMNVISHPIKMTPPPLPKSPRPTSHPSGNPTATNIPQPAQIPIPSLIKPKSDNVTERHVYNDNSNGNVTEKVNDSSESLVMKREIPAPKPIRPVSSPDPGRKLGESDRNRQTNRNSMDSSTLATQARGKKASNVNVKRISSFFESNSSTVAQLTRVQDNTRKRQSAGPSISEKVELLSPRLSMRHPNAPPTKGATTSDEQVNTQDSARNSAVPNLAPEHSFRDTPSTLRVAPMLPQRPISTSPTPKNAGNISSPIPSRVNPLPTPTFDVSRQPPLVPPHPSPQEYSIKSTPPPIRHASPELQSKFHPTSLPYEPEERIVAKSYVPSPPPDYMDEDEPHEVYEPSYEIQETPYSVPATPPTLRYDPQETYVPATPPISRYDPQETPYSYAPASPPTSKWEPQDNLPEYSTPPPSRHYFEQTPSPIPNTPPTLRHIPQEASSSASSTPPPFRRELEVEEMPTSIHVPFTPPIPRYDEPPQDLQSTESKIPDKSPPPPPLSPSIAPIPPPESRQIPIHPPPLPYNNYDDRISISSRSSASSVNASSVASDSKADLMEQIRQFGQSGQVLKKAASDEGGENKRTRKSSMHVALESRLKAFSGENSDSGEGESEYGDDDSDNWED